MNLLIKAIALGSLVFFTSLTAGSESGLEYIETADGLQSIETRELVQWTHTRFIFNKDLERVAVGQESTLQLEVLDNNEVLALAKRVGRTSIMVWYADNTSETLLVSVIEDFSVLHEALKDIHPGIQLTQAPDRAALVLRGQVPTLNYRVAAEEAARHYLDAGQTRRSSLLQPTSALANAAGIRLPTNDNVPVGQSQRSAIINLIKVEELPLDLTKKVKNAIANLGGSSVSVKRIQKGDIPNDEIDTILLGGQVETQVDLVRVLNLAARLITGEYADISESGVNTIANESGGLVSASNGNSNNGLGNSSNSFLGNTGSRANMNSIQSNIARAKLLSIAGGRILSTIEVRDLPQVRVAVQMYEVNRRMLSQWRPDYGLMTNGYDQSSDFFSLNGLNQNNTKNKIENALQALGGALVNNLQVSNGDIAFDLLFSMLEREGVSRTLSRPTLTVLSGESAVFRAGGEVPVPSAYAPNGIVGSDQAGFNTSGVFSGTQFKSFGVELEVRALVDENDRITLDLSPTISMPDTILTEQISGSTGSSLNTAAFNVRSLNTSTRLRDGQPLIIGGLVSRDTSESLEGTPGLRNIPGLGKFNESNTNSENTKELIIIVTPTLVREARHNYSVWEFPAGNEISMLN